MTEQTQSAGEQQAFESWWRTGQWPTDVAPSAWAHRESALRGWLARAALAQQPAAQAAGLTTEQIEEVWRGVEWKDLSPVHEGFEKALRLRFARALLSRAAPSGEAVAYVECRECCRCGHTGINDAHAQDACCSNCDWTGPAPKEDLCPGCAQTGTMRAACPKCGSVYRLLCETTVGAAPQPSGGKHE